MNKYSSHFLRSLLLLAILLPASMAAFAQENKTENDLKRSFWDFQLLRADDFGLRSEGSVYLAGDGVYRRLVLVPRDLRSRRYIAEDTTFAGTRKLERTPVSTYVGSIEGDDGSTARMTIRDGYMEGYFVSKGQRYFVEPAFRYSESAGRKEIVVYRPGDHLDERGFVCESEFEKRLGKGKTTSGLPDRTELEGPAVLELATEADNAYVNQLGGAQQANNEILGVLNMVEGVFQEETDISIEVVFQHTWTSADPFNGTNANTLLSSFQNHWNTNYTSAEYARDSTHLFSARPAVLSMGLAYVGTVCNFASAAYGLTGYISWAPGKYLVTAHELGHNLDANHVDSPQGCGNTLMNPVLSGATPLTFCQYSRDEITGHVSQNGDCLAPPAVSSPSFDFDGDSLTDVSVWRPGNGVWYIYRSSDTGVDAHSFGQQGDKAIAADYDGDGMTDAAVFRNGTWYTLNSSDSTFSALVWGVATDLPAPGDFDGDGKADHAVFRPSDGIWHVLRSADSSYYAVAFGAPGDHPLPYDYDGDGKADINVWRPSEGAWYRLNSSNGAFWAAPFGQAGDIPLKGDFDGDAKGDLAIFRPSSGFWFVYRSTNNSFYGAPFGTSTDIPTPGDFDGDGTTDIAVYRPETGVWYRLNSSDSNVVAIAFGAQGDVPTPAPIPQ